MEKLLNVTTSAGSGVISLLNSSQKEITSTYTINGTKSITIPNNTYFVKLKTVNNYGSHNFKIKEIGIK